MIANSPKDLALLAINQRKLLKLTQRAVADMVGLKQKTISAFENKPESTKIETVFLILSALKLDIGITPKNQNDIKKWNQEW
jgi:HTH-type transcriptional regulator/antitoxin HipB